MEKPHFIVKEIRSWFSIPNISFISHWTLSSKHYFVTNCYCDSSNLTTKGSYSIEEKSLFEYREQNDWDTRWFNDFHQHTGILSSRCPASQGKKDNLYPEVRNPFEKFPCFLQTKNGSIFASELSLIVFARPKAKYLSISNKWWSKSYVATFRPVVDYLSMTV